MKGKRQQPLWKYAGILAKRICFPSVGENMDLLARAIQTEIDYSGASPEVAARFLASEVIRDRNERGETIDRWYFVDGRWRNKRLTKMERGQFERIRAHEAAMERIAEDAARTEEMRSAIVGHCTGCKRPKFASDNWTDFCCASCHEDYSSRVADRDRADQNYARLQAYEDLIARNAQREIDQRRSEREATA